AFEEAGDCRVALGPIGGEHLDPRLAEGVADLAAVNRGHFVDLAAEAPVGGEIDEHRMALLEIACDARLAPGLGARELLRRRCMIGHQPNAPNRQSNPATAPPQEPFLLRRWRRP